MKIKVEGVELTVSESEQGRVVAVTKTIGRDRKLKRDITDMIQIHRPTTKELIDVLKRAARLQTAQCTCDYRYGYSDHYEHCKSIYVAEEYIDHDD